MGSCSSPPDVVWVQAVGDKSVSPARRVSIKDSIQYTATLNVVNTSFTTYGLYGAYVCDKQLLNFTVVHPPSGVV